MPRCFSWPPILASVVLGLMLLGPESSSQEVGLVPLDSNQTKEIAKGYRAEALKLKTVTNDKGEMIGRIDDFILGHESPAIFAVLAVGEVIGPGNHLVAVPFRSLKLDDPSGFIVLPGASRVALQKLPVFLYNK
jgi:hypothetical protein